MTDDYEDVAYLISSDHRAAVAKSILENGPSTPSAISEDVDLRLEHVSRALTTMREDGFTLLAVDEDRRKGRLYALTDRGEAAAEQVGDVNY